MKNYAVIFPGQGSQRSDMINTYENVKNFNLIIEQASEILKYNVKAAIRDESKLNDTTYTQPIIVAVSIAMWNTWINETALQPKYAAGHSLGEYSALVASGMISLDDCLNLVKERALMMIDAMNGRKSAMAAVLGLESAKIEAICAESSNPDCIIEAVNYNSDFQTVIAGDASGINQAITLLKKAGAKLIKPIPVSVASHTSIMKICSEKLNKLLLNIQFNTGNFPIFHNIDASCKNSTSGIIESLCKQVYSPVLWSKTIDAMCNKETDTFVEIGPGSVLTGLNKRINKDIKSYNISNYNAISEVIAK